MGETMRAVRLHRWGGPEVLQLEEIPVPAPGEGEVRVRVHAAGVNPVDWKVREGWLGGLPFHLPLVPGWDVSGVVDAVGPGVVDLAVGDEVFGKPDLVRDGAYAEQVVVRRDALARKPAALSHLQAAALPIAGLTAWQALFEDHRGAPTLGVRAGQTVLVLGGAGGVGSFAVQLARWRGARVLATGRPENAEYLRGLGAEPLDYTAGPLAAREVDAVLDLVGGALRAGAWDALRRGGAIASIVGAPDPEEAARRGVHALAVFGEADGAHLDALAGLAVEGRLRVELAQVLPLAEAVRAQELSRTGRVRGKLVLAVRG